MSMLSPDIKKSLAKSLYIYRDLIAVDTESPVKLSSSATKGFVRISGLNKKCSNAYLFIFIIYIYLMLLFISPSSA